MTMLFRLPLVLALFSAAHFVPLAVSTAEAASCAKKKKKKKAAPAAQEAPKKLTSADILKWHKAGLSDDEIVARADAGGFKLTALAVSRLKKAHAPKSLILALSGKPAEAPAAEEAAPTPAAAPARATVAAKPEAPKVKPINITDLTDPNDIDFDSVPPPAGVPKEYQSSPKSSHVASAPAKKQLDRSVRPSAPFEAPKQAAQPQARPASASRGQAGAGGNAAPQAGKKRVVFAAKEGGG